MKKLCAALLTIAIIMTAGVCVRADTFNGYWDFQKEDGSYAYAFPRIMVTMDENWYQNTRVVLGENNTTASFYHKDSYNAYAAEGLNGGLLFTIGASVNTDFQNLPSFAYLGFDEEEAMNYYAELPTDYQAYTGDEKIRAEYNALWSEVETVLENVLIKGSEKYKELYENKEAGSAANSDDVAAKSDDAAAKSDDAASKADTSKDYEYSINEDKKTVTITKYTGDAEEIEIPSEIDGCQVTDIGAEAFRYRKLKSVSIPEGVHSIGAAAFEYCTISDNLTLPEKVTISEDAFSYAKLPVVLIIPAGTTIEKCAFSYCEIMECVLIGPESVLKSRAFGYCEELNQAVCADKCKLEENAFEYCRKLKKAVLCGDVETVEESFFCYGETEVTTAEADEFDRLKQSALDGSLTGNKDSSPAEEEERVLTILDSPVSQDGVTVTLEKAVAKRTDVGGFEYIFDGTIENNSDEGIMQVLYTFALIDEEGEEYRSFGIKYDGEDKALPAHESVTFSHDGIKWGPQSVPASVRIGISSVKTEAELPPVKLPKTGEYLYQALGNENLANIKEKPPVELSFHVDQGGYGRTATFKSGAELDKAVELFCGIKIGKESGEWVTDNYNGISLTWEDGTRTGISLNLRNLEYFAHSTPHTYELEHLDEFWSYCADYLKEDG